MSHDLNLPERTPAAAPAAAGGDARLDWLLRGLPERGLGHPLRAMLVQHRGCGAAPALPVPRAAAARPPARSAGPAAWPLDAARLREQVDALPALPQAVLDAQQMLQREDSDGLACAALLARDAGLAARVLRVANSPFYGRPGRVGSLAEAVVVLGRRTLGALLTGLAVRGPFEGVGAAGLDLAQFWRHAFGTALAAQALARLRGEDDAQAFSAGLLHDIGRLVLAVHAPQALAAAQALARAEDLATADAEQRVMGLDHGLVGGLIAEHWRFPPAVAAAIVGHHRGVGAAAEPLADLVQAADALTHALDLSAADDERVPDTDPALWLRLQLPADAWAQVLSGTAAGVAALAQAWAL